MVRIRPAIIDSIQFLLHCIWPDAKKRNYHAPHWIKAHVGVVLSNANMEQLRIIQYLLAFKARDGDCPIIEHRVDNGDKRRRRVVPGKTTWANLRRQLIASAQFRCQRCRKQKQFTELTLDHITPVFAGGSSEPSNLQVLCEPCHAAKTRREDWRAQKMWRKKFLPENVRLSREYYYRFLMEQKKAAYGVGGLEGSGTM